VRLRVLLPPVENAVSGTAVHPMDIVRTRKGLTVEIGNIDAEGQLILCDALVFRRCCKIPKPTPWGYQRARRLAPRPEPATTAGARLRQAARLVRRTKGQLSR
jgi:hypothetical protein